VAVLIIQESKNHKEALLKGINALVGLIILLFCIDVHGVENGKMSYKNINKILTLIDKHAQSPYTGLLASVSSDVQAIALGDIELSVIHNDKLLNTVGVGEDGSVDFFLLAEKIGNKAIVHINQPKGTVSLSLSAGVKKIKSHQVRYDDIFSVLDDLDKVASEMIGLPTWMLPDLDYLVFHFDSPSVITLTGNGTHEVYQSNTENIIEIERNSDFKKSMLVFSKLPFTVTFLH
jgi:hypothetical protein